ncbi:MAG: serine hydrolase domain-containing protein [Ilumatobacteraceae bacterium]
MLVRRGLLGIAVVPLLLAQCGPTQCAPPPPPANIDVAWSSFDQDLSGRLLGGGASAASVTVSVDGTVVHSAAYGARLPWTGEPTQVGDQFRVASISKTITAIVVLQLVEAGRLGLDQAVGDALAQRVGASPVDGRVSGITVRQLLSHTSGLGTNDLLMFGGTVPTCPAAARAALSASLIVNPGTTYVYANVGYCLLGLLIEHVSGRSYESVVRDQLLTPLGIAGMRVAGQNDFAAADVFHWALPNRNYMDVLGAAGSWIASSSDVVRIIDSLDVGKPGFHPLSAGTTELMRQHRPFRYSPDRWYGLGLICFVDGTWGHTGTLESAHAMVLHRPDGITWSILVSGDTPKDSDELKAMFDDVIARAGVLPFLGR